MGVAMLRDTLVQIKKFSTFETKDMHKMFNDVRSDVHREERKLARYLKGSSLRVMLNTHKSVKAEFAKRYGFPLDCTRLNHWDSGPILARKRIWLKVKKCIPNYYELSSADITDRYVKTCSSLNRSLYREHVLHKQFTNGNCLYEPTNELLYHVHLVNTIIENFKGM